MTIWEFDAWLIDRARAMPRAMNKGDMSQMMQNANTANAENTQLTNMGIGAEQQVLPFLQSEIANPQGFGQQGVNEMLTAGGQAASGATGQATEAANLRASRSGNPSSTSSIIDAAARAGMQNQTNNANNVNIQNLQEKLKQQQAGASRAPKRGPVQHWPGTQRSSGSRINPSKII